MGEVIESTEKLKKNVASLYEMEMNNYLMTRLIDKMDSTINGLCVSRRFEAPKMGQTKQRLSATGNGALLGGFAGVLLGVFVGCSNSSGIFTAIDNLVMGFLLGALFGLMIGGVIGYLIDMNAVEEEKNELQKKYDAAYQLYKRNMDEDSKRVNREEKFREALIAERDELVKKRKDSLLLLGSMYEIMGIDRGFRSLVAVGYMNEFLRLGIATKLEGIDGLYYLIQQRIQFSVLNATMQEISSKLDTIINNQDRIYYELQEMNGKFDKMIAGVFEAVKVGVDNGKRLEEIQNNTGIAAYNAERMRREYEYRNLVGWD
ncbi:MAG: hypothetical protein IJ009_06835 [Clostridia bacterium]|nr:hypothetical protein [Clostridia bacterium]